jgi:hypothetical protein
VTDLVSFRMWAEKHGLEHGVAGDGGDPYLVWISPDDGWEDARPDTFEEDHPLYDEYFDKVFLGQLAAHLAPTSIAVLREVGYSARSGTTAVSGWSVAVNSKGSTVRNALGEIDHVAATALSGEVYSNGIWGELLVKNAGPTAAPQPE